MQEIYNVRTKNNEDFIIKDNKLKIYLCGPTVYDSVHIGNIRPLIFFDTIASYFSYLKVAVDSISNITDIDDKIMKISHIKKLVKDMLWNILVYLKSLI